MSEPDLEAGTDVERRLVWLRRGVWTVLGAGILAFLVQGADNPPDPVLVPASDVPTTTDAIRPEATDDVVADPVTVEEPATTVVSSPPASSSTTSTTETVTTVPPPPESTTTTTVVRRPLPGFGETAFRITDSGGGVFDGMALLAATEESRRRGLMEQTDLRGYDAMVFRSPRPTTGTFFMRNTRIPLSIAFFDLYGRFVSAADMEPCPDQVERCPTYSAAGPYLYALEVTKGDLGRQGIGPGSVLSFPSP